MTLCPWCDEELSDMPGADGKRPHVSPESWCPGPPEPEPSRWPEDQGDVR